MVLWLSGTPAGHESTVPFISAAAGAETTMSIRDYKRWDAEIKKRTRQIRRAKDEAVRWGNEKRAHPSNMIVLDEPLETSRPDHVLVEWFNRWIDDDGGSWASISARDLVYIGWSENLLREEKLPVLFRDMIVAEGPGLRDEFVEPRKRMQEITAILGLRIHATGIETAELTRELMKRATEGRLRHLKREVDVRRLIEGAGIDWNAWEAEQTPIIEEWEPWATDRWSRMAEQALAQDPNVFEYVPDPIILIDGKYLVTQNTVRQQGGWKAPETVLKVANWLIRRQLERMPQHGFDPERIKWGNNRRPRRGELVELKEPFPKNADGIVVEWAHSYVTAEGQPKAIEWFEEVRELWVQSLTGAGIDGVQTDRIPLVDSQGLARDHQMVHREATIAWGPQLPERRNLIHFAMAKHLATYPRGLGTHEAVGKMLDGVSGTNRQIYEAVRGSSNRVAMLEDAKRKGAAIKQALARKKEVRDPVFLLNGRYVIAADSVTEAYQLLNWAIAQIRKR